MLNEINCLLTDLGEIVAILLHRRSFKTVKSIK